METIDQLNAKCSGLEKTKSRLQGELEDMTIEVEKVNGFTILFYLTILLHLKMHRSKLLNLYILHFHL